MKKLLLLLFFASPCFGQYYTTTFPATENPIAQGSPSLWAGGQSAGGNLWGNVQTGRNSLNTKQIAFGVNPMPTQFGDPTALLTGLWGPTQTVSGVVSVDSPAPSGNCCHEIELRLRQTINSTNHTISGYEAYCSVMPAPNSYCHIARWNGPSGSYCNLDSSPPAITVVNGDTLTATATGTNPVVITLFRNGTQILTVNDTGQNCSPGGAGGPFVSGSPGIGFFDSQDSNWNHFGYSSFTAQGGVLAATCNQSDVLTAINSVSDGDTVLIPNGTCDWTNGLTGQFAINTTKQIQLLAQNLVITPNGGTYGTIPARNVTIINDTSAVNATPNQWQGNWSSATSYVIGDRVKNDYTGCLTGCDGNYYLAISAHTNHQPPNATFWKPVAALIGFTSGNNFHQRIAGIYFKETSVPIFNAVATSGSGTKEPFFDNNTVEIAQRFGNEPGIAVLALTGIGFVTWNDYIVGVTTAGVPAGECCPGGASVHTESPYSWYNADTLGMQDTLGNINGYFEDSVWDNFGQGWDADNNSRIVARHMVLNGIATQTHGLSSTTGGRHVEIYNSVIGNPHPQRNLSQRYNWDREGIWYIGNNTVAYQNQGFGAASLFNSIVECSPGNTCANDGSVPYPHFKVPGGEQTSWSCSTCTGVQSTSVPANHPTYIWNNCIAGDVLPCVGDSHIAAGGGTSPFFVQLNRDYFVDSGPPPGYTPFTYPHPDRALAFGGGTVAAAGSVTVVPSSENFGSVVVGASSGNQTATLTNTTASSITITSVTQTGNTADFPNVTPPAICSGTIAANGGTCVVTSKFSPTSTGSRNATLTIATSAGSFPVTQSGTGTSATLPGVSIAPASIAFGNMSVGSSTPATTVTITSTTSANLVMGTPPATITGTNAGDFLLQAIGGQCTNGQSIPQSSTCLESVLFHPTVAGARSAQLNIFDNVTGNPQIVPLTGTGVGTIAVNPVSLNFGLVAQGQTSPSQPVVITNNTGVTLTLTGTTFTNLDFAGSGCSTGTLTNGSQCTANITFRPSATTGTNEVGSLLINYTGIGGSPVSVTLSGTVLPPIGTPATNIFAKNLAGCGAVPKLTTFCFTATGKLYVAVCNPTCVAYTPFTLMAQ